MIGNRVVEKVEVRFHLRNAFWPYFFRIIVKGVYCQKLRNLMSSFNLGELKKIGVRRSFSKVS